MVRPVSIGVLVDLEFSPNAGGHVKCWERFVQAASRYTGLTDSQFDLTVYFLDRPAGKNGTEKTVHLSPATRIKTVPAVSGTRQHGLQQGAGHTDLVRFHPGLASHLVRHDVLHVTSCFALSETAAAISRQRGVALTGSLHTHVPAFAEIYAPDAAAARFGGSKLIRRLSRLARVDRLGRQLTQYRVDRVFGACSYLLAATAADRAALAHRYPEARVGPLGRGIDLGRFDPVLRDRHWLAERTGFPDEAVVACFVGRIDASKQALLVARVVAGLRNRHLDVCLLAVGEGRDRAAIKDLLGPAACLPGSVDQAELARVYASSDFFLFPSQTETFGNAVLEARASGLPVVLPVSAAASALEVVHEKDGILVKDQRIASWIECAMPVAQDAALRQRLGQAARLHAETRARSWGQVFAEDLLPVWLEAAGAMVQPQPGDRMFVHAADASMEEAGMSEASA